MVPAMDQEAVDGFIKITTYTSTNYYYFCYFYYLNEYTNTATTKCQ